MTENEYNFKIDPKLSEKYYDGRASNPFPEKVSSVKVVSNEDEEGKVARKPVDTHIPSVLYDCDSEGRELFL